MPLNTAVPSERRAPELAPLASTSGSTPRMKANDVIRIGRSRRCAASMAASRTLLPCSCAFLGELDDQNGVLGGQSDQRHDADLRVDVVRVRPQPDAGQRAEHAERHAPAARRTGIDQLSYSAARKRNTSTAAKPKMAPSLPCACFS